MPFFWTRHDPNHLGSRNRYPPGLAEGTGVFKPLEIVALREVLDDYHPASEAGHRALTIEEKGQSSRLRLLRSDSHDRPDLAPVLDLRREGHPGSRPRCSSPQTCGGRHRSLRRAARLLSRPRRCHRMIRLGSSTSSTATSRRPVVRDFYSDGDDQVIFRKRLGSANTG